MGKGGSAPSGNTTTTVQQQNPLANAQLPYLGGLWSSADWIRQNPGSLGSASDALWNLPGYAANQGWNTAQVTGNLMPTAAQQYLNLINRGIPSADYASGLANNAATAANQGLGFGQALTGAAGGALNQVPEWQNRFLGAGQNALDTLQGYGGAATNALSGVGNYALNTLPGMGQAATGALTGLAPGALSGLSNLSGRAATAANPAEAGLGATAGMALANPALASGLRGLASGAYINPATNPAYAGMLQAATQPLVNQYQTATAPQTISPFEAGGRYGSGAETNAVGQAQYGLGQALSNAVSGITNNAYNTGLNATVGAGSALGGIYNQGVNNMISGLTNQGQLAQSGVNNAANILNQGYGTAGNLLSQGYQTGGNLINQGITGGTNALSNAYTIGGNLANQGFNAQNAAMANAANTALGFTNAGISGLGAGAGAANAGLATSNTALTGGGQLLNTGDLALSNALSQAQGFATYPESQYTQAYNSAWLPLSNESSILGGAVGGTGTTQTSQPYYNNTGANILGGLTGGLGLANTLGGAQGIFPGAISAGLTALGGF